MLSGSYPAVVQSNISMKVDWASRADCMASSVSGSNCDDLLWGHQKECVYAVLPRLSNISLRDLKQL
jgi:hypothetical protein